MARPGVSEPTLQMDEGKGFQRRVFAAEEEQGTPQGHPKGLARNGEQGHPVIPGRGFPSWQADPLVMTYKKLLKMAIEIVELPIKHGVVQ